MTLLHAFDIITYQSCNYAGEYINACNAVYLHRYSWINVLKVLPMVLLTWVWVRLSLIKGTGSPKQEHTENYSRVVQSSISANPLQQPPILGLLWIINLIGLRTTRTSNLDSNWPERPVIGRHTRAKSHNALRVVLLSEKDWAKTWRARLYFIDFIRFLDGYRGLFKGCWVRVLKYYIFELTRYVLMHILITFRSFITIERRM